MSPFGTEHLDLPPLRLCGLCGRGRSWKPGHLLALISGEGRCKENTLVNMYDIVFPERSHNQTELGRKCQAAIAGYFDLTSPHCHRISVL
jgi:hypothetical protein